MYFIWKGTESIKWLETYSAPILIGIGLVLIYWSYSKAEGFTIVLDQSVQLEKAAATITEKDDAYYLHLNVLKNKEGQLKANEFNIVSDNITTWEAYTEKPILIRNIENVQVQFRNSDGTEPMLSSIVTANVIDSTSTSTSTSSKSKLWNYLLWLTAMVGFWATMSISIADITRYAATQKDQVTGQFLGLPLTMMLYSFVGIFVTCAAIINFKDVLIAEDAPWDPVSLIAKFENPVVVIIAQIFKIIATLSTNIAANVIAPSNAFSNLWPKKISFKAGGTITGIIGILILPWWLLDEISGFLIFVSGLLGPVLGILIADYYFIRKKEMVLAELYKEEGIYSYGKTGFNKAAMISLIVSVFLALIGYWVPALNFLYSLSWFTGFIIAFVMYYLLMKNNKLV
jgi:cytosine/uracil/thiamine/allantoin permease